MNIDLSTIPDAPKNTIDLSAIPDEKPEASWGQVEKTTAKNILPNLAAGGTGAVALGIESTENIPSGLFPAVELLKRLKEPVQYAAKYWYDQAQKNTDELNLKPGSAKSYASMIQESTAQQLPLIAGGMATGGTGFILPAMGILTAGQKKAQFLSHGLEGGNLNAITQGIIEAVTEQIPLGQWLKPGAKFMKRLLTATATEIPGEQIATITQGALDKIALNPEMSWNEYLSSLPTATKDTLIVTIGQSLLMSGVIHAVAKNQLVDQFQVPEPEAEKAIETAEQNIAPTPEQMAGLREVLGDNPEEEIQKVKNAAIISKELNIPVDIAHEYQDEIIKELENKVTTESPMMVGEPKATQPGAPKQPIVAYHGTTKDFAIGEIKTTDESIVPDRLIGSHFSIDPSVASNFAKGEGGNVKQVVLDIKNPRELPQKIHPNGEMASDQWSFQVDMARMVFPRRKDLFVDYWSSMRSMPKEEVSRIYDKIKNGEEINWENNLTDKGIYTFEDIADNYGMLISDKKMSNEFVNEYKNALSDLGYDGIKYKNTSPMEMQGAKDNTTYIPLSKEQIKDYPELQAQSEHWKYNNSQQTIYRQGGVKDLVGLPDIKPDEIVTNEKELLKFRLKSEARGAKAGYKEGRSIARAETILKFKEQNLTAEDAKKSVVNYLNESLEPKDRGKFLTVVRDAKTPEQAAKAFSRIDRYAEKQELKGAIRNLKTTTDKLSESKTISVDYRNKIKDVIDQYELSGHSEKIIEKMQATQDYLDRIKSEGEDITMPQRVLNKLKILSRIPKDELTLSQVQGLQNEIELMGKLGKTKWKSKVALYEGEKKIRKETLLETSSPINSEIIPKVPIGEEPHQWVNRYIKFRNYLQKTRIGVNHPIDALADITGMQPMKADLDLNYGEYLLRNIPNIEDFSTLETNMLELGEKLTQGQRNKVGVYGARVQEGGYEKLENLGRTKEEVDAVVLSEEEKSFYDAIQKFNNTTYPAVKKYAMDIYNIDIGKVDNYMSYMTDYDAMNDLEMYDRIGDRAKTALTKTTEQGFLKERTGAGGQKIELDALKIAQRHADDIAYMLTMGKDLKQYFEIINSPEMKAKLGDVGSLAWLQYLDMMARKGGSMGSKRLAGLDSLRKYASGVLSFRLSSALVQVTSLTDSVSTIGVDWTYKGVSDIATSKEWRDFVIDNFPEIKRAVGDDIAYREFNNNLYGEIVKKGMKPLQYLDGIIRTMAACGAYQKLSSDLGIPIDLKNPNKGLIQEATKLMRYSQGSSFYKDQPLALTTGFGLTDNLSLNKAILQFQSFMLNRWSNIVRQIWRMGIKEKDYKKAASSFFWLVLVAGALETGIRKGTKEIIEMFGDEEDKHKDSFVGNMALNIVQNVPTAGQLISSLTYSSNPVPVLNMLTEAGGGIQAMVKGKKTETKVKGAIKTIGAAVPVTSQAAQIIRKSVD
jgi:hypothetical protein